MRIIICCAVILAAVTAVAADLTPEQLKTLKQQQAQLTAAKTALINAINEANASCSTLVDQATKNVTCEQAVDPKTSYLRAKTQAGDVATLAASMQTAYKKWIEQQQAATSACSEQSKASQTVVKDADAHVAAIESLVSQWVTDPAQFSQQATLLKKHLQDFQTAMVSISKIQDGTNNTLLVTGQQSTAIQGTMASMLSASRKLPISAPDTADVQKAAEALQAACGDQFKKTTDQANESKEATEAARDRRKAAQDNIQKFLDILRSINPQI